jgi:ABC-type amino acid transport substrate-binding protein
MIRFRTALEYLAAFVVLVILITGCQSGDGGNKQTKSTYQRVLEAGKIRVGYISYPPSFIKDPNTGDFSGIFHEVIKEVGKNLELEIDYTEELGWGTMVEAVSSRRVDLVCTGIWPTSARGRRADFTLPIYYSAVRAYTRVDNSKFDSNLTVINSPGVRISTIDGEMTSIIARSDFPNAKTESLPQTADISQVLLEVATNKADVCFVEPAVALEYISKNPGTIKEVRNVPPLRVFPNVMMIGKGEVELASMLNIAIEELINNGFVEKVIQKYEKYEGSFQRTALPYRTE